MLQPIKSLLHEPAQQRYFLKLLLIYLAIALPFKTLDLLPGFANIRPNSALIPIYGYLFGPIGALINGMGNFFYDILTGSFSKGSPAGAAANFIVPLFMCFVWKHCVGERFCLKTLRHLYWYTLIAAMAAVLKAIIITPAVLYFYLEVSGPSFFQIVVITEITFYLMPGAAILIWLQCFYGFKGYEPAESFKTDSLAPEKSYGQKTTNRYGQKKRGL